MANEPGNRDIVLAPGTYAFLQDETRGQIKTYTGPCVINQTAQDKPVRFDSKRNTFVQCNLEEAVQHCPVASEGDYIVLENPSTTDEIHPSSGVSANIPDLGVGKKQNIPGPCTFALWPMQRANVINGHRLRSNQFLVVRVYNEEEARNNWNQGVARPAVGGDDDEAITQDRHDLTIGQLMVIKGTDVSFYIPPTGVEVLADENEEYIRNAVSLERLEYCILVDEDGNKRYEKGPQVVFPEPTEIFFIEDGNRKFRAIELNNIQGIHVKVIESYDDQNAGDEIFITGEDFPIYFPRAEHSIIEYGDKKKHCATAIPSGEGRYVMNRNTGVIRKEQGPQMLLPDPRNHVIVRRVLSDRQCNLWYPGNREALSYNQSLRNVGAGKSGFVDEGSIQNFRNAPHRVKNLASNLSNTGYGAGLEDMESVGDASTPDSIRRGTKYTQPRTITLDTKFEGVPNINIYTGYAVKVVNKSGERRVVQGPQTILLEYDETLEVLQLSTGKPKNTDNIQDTVYLRVSNNKVGDIISVKTKDHVDVSIKVSYRVNFEGDPEKWFNAENYVKLLCDHCRSILKGVSQKTTIEDFYADGVRIIRDAILGQNTGEGGDRPGLLFEENDMRVCDVEILDIDVKDQSIAQMLSDSQQSIVRSNIELRKEAKDLEVTEQKEKIFQQKAEAQNATKKLEHHLAQILIGLQAETELATVKSKIDIATQAEKAAIAEEAVVDISARSELQRRKDEENQKIDIQREESRLRVEEENEMAAALVKKFEAIQPGLCEALLQLQSQETLTKVAQAMSAQQMLGGKNLVDVIGQLFKGSAAEPMLAQLFDRVKGGIDIKEIVADANGTGN